MAEEQNWQEATNHTLCANNCGFFGSPTTLNLCSKCYKDRCLKEQHISEAKIAVEKSLSHQHQPETSSSSSSSSSSNPPPPPPSSSPAVAPSSSSSSVSSDLLTAVGEAAVADPVVKPQTRNRCGSCRRRVGLTGFTCRCGTTFCGTHRYPEQHGCGFDFKSMGKEAIARANPVVKAAKLEKI